MILSPGLLTTLGLSVSEPDGHNVVITVLPELQHREASAIAVARHDANRNIRIGVMVGIAGGAPTSKNDIHLGDIQSALHENARLLFFSTTSGRYTKAHIPTNRHARILEPNSSDGNGRAQGDL
ncbi:hypothetical protein V2G26_003379 [Clonostachys chloroleuca]